MMNGRDGERRRGVKRQKGCKVFLVICEIVLRKISLIVID